MDEYEQHEKIITDALNKYKKSINVVMQAGIRSFVEK